MPKKCCDLVYWKHDDGWDVFLKSDCQRLSDGTFVPRWFDCQIVEDAPTKKAARAEIAELHQVFCLVNFIYM